MPRCHVSSVPDPCTHPWEAFSLQVFSGASLPSPGPLVLPGNQHTQQISFQKRSMPQMLSGCPMSQMLWPLQCLDLMPGSVQQALAELGRQHQPCMGCLSHRAQECQPGVPELLTAPQMLHHTGRAAGFSTASLHQTWDLIWIQHRLRLPLVPLLRAPHQEPLCPGRNMSRKLQEPLLGLSMIC